MAVVTISSAALCKASGLSEEEAIAGLTNIGMPVEFGELQTLLVEVTPNRPDLFSVWGLARALKAYARKEIPKYHVESSGYSIAVSKKTKGVRPAISASVVKGLKIDEDAILGLMQLQEKLHDTIGRRRKKVAIGIHDLKPIMWPLEYVVAAGECFVPLDCEEEMDVRGVLKNHPKGIAFAHLVGENAVVIKDNAGVISFPPIINSERTRVTANSKDVLVDVTGTSQETVDTTLNIVTTALVDLGGTAYSVNVGGKKCPDFAPKKIKINLKEANSVLGLALSQKEAESCLLRMGVRSDGKNALIPPYRADVISFTDVLEDIAIGYGYENFAPTLPAFNNIGKGKKNRKAIRGAMVGMGFSEIMTHILSNKETLSVVGRGEGALGIKNSASKEFNVLRTSLLQSVLLCFSNNKMKGLPQQFYEIGVVYDGGEEERLCFGEMGEGASMTSLQPYLQTLMKEIGVGFELQPCADPVFISGRCAYVVVEGENVGVIGSAHPKIIEWFGLPAPISLCELKIGKLDS
ncbi:MAG: phenylalanine--tRNA ligase subunit beta [Candidatus Bilamarchaeaceae archaeon]